MQCSVLSAIDREIGFPHFLRCGDKIIDMAVKEPLLIQMQRTSEEPEKRKGFLDCCGQCLKYSNCLFSINQLTIMFVAHTNYNTSMDGILFDMSGGLMSMFDCCVRGRIIIIHMGIAVFAGLVFEFACLIPRQCLHIPIILPLIIPFDVGLHNFVDLDCICNIRH